LNRDTRNIIELGAICGICVILLNFFLAQFTVLIWPALGISAVVFASLIVDSLSHHTQPQERASPTESNRECDELTRLQDFIERGVARQEMYSIVLEKLRTVGLSMASARMNLSKEQLSELIENTPEAGEKVGDAVLLSFLTCKKPSVSNVEELDNVLSRIERL
jgi:heme exporter protein D